jgi:hypothetical protein
VRKLESYMRVNERQAEGYSGRQGDRSMKRRTVLQLAAAMLAVPRIALAQARTYRLAYLGGTSAAASAPMQRTFFARLEGFGYVDAVPRRPGDRVSI